MLELNVYHYHIDFGGKYQRAPLNGWNKIMMRHDTYVKFVHLSGLLQKKFSSEFHFDLFNSENKTYVIHNYDYNQSRSVMISISSDVFAADLLIHFIYSFANLQYGMWFDATIVHVDISLHTAGMKTTQFSANVKFPVF